MYKRNHKGKDKKPSLNSSQNNHLLLTKFRSNLRLLIANRHHAQLTLVVPIHRQNTLVQVKHLGQWTILATIGDLHLLTSLVCWSLLIKHCHMRHIVNYSQLHHHGGRERRIVRWIKQAEDVQQVRHRRVMSTVHPNAPIRCHLSLNLGLESPQHVL